MKRILTLAVLLAIISATSVQAHPGRTDTSGGHTCRTNCAKWGLREGEYHYHNGGGSSVPAITPTAPVAPKSTAPRTPAVRTQTVNREEVVEFKTITRYDYREYSRFTKVAQPGKVGARVITTTITYTDGKETGRNDTNNEVVVQPEDEIIIKGGRSVSPAKIYGIAQSPKGMFTSNAGKYNVWGKYKSNATVYMTFDDQKTQSVKANSEGWFTFEKVKIAQNKGWLQIFSKEKNDVNSISEKTQVNLDAKRLTTEYDLIHKKK